VGIALAIAAALCWGTSDFLAGLASRRFAVPLVLLVVEGGGLLVVGVVALAVGPAFFDHGTDALQAAGAGLSGVLALGCFYRALAIGTMSVVAPISAAGVVLPVIVGIISGDRLGVAQAVGLVLTVLGVVLASREQHADAQAAETGRAAIGLALLAAVGFGGFFVLTKAPAESSVLWTLVLARFAPLPFVAVLVLKLRPVLPSPRQAIELVGIGLVDLSATALIALANTQGELSIVSVLGGMYPVMTVLLAAAVLHERLRGAQLAGVGLALSGVALVAAG
jgi:drug/metabolite transporter (DMT)-like permease